MDKEDVAHIYNGTLLSHKKINNSTRTWAKNRSRRFTEENLQITKKLMKRCSVLLSIKEMQFKTTMIFHYIPIRMTKIKKSDKTKCWGGCRQNESLITHPLPVGMQNVKNHSGSSLAAS